jgi:chromate transporter
MMDMPASGAERPVPDLGQLFTGFLVLGLTGFGGVLPLAHRMVVEKRRWLSSEEFTDLLGLCQFLPGGNVINMSVAIGQKFRGIPGAVAALLGLITAPTAIVIALGVLYDRFGNSPQVRHLFTGLAAAAAGLLVAMAIKVALPLRGKPVAIVVAVLCFVTIAVFRFPLLPAMAVLVPLSIAAAWRTAR